MNAPSSSSSIAATITTVEAAAATAAVAVTMRIARWIVEKKKNHDEIILQTVIGKCHTAMK